MAWHERPRTSVNAVASSAPARRARSAFPIWAYQNQRLRERVAAMTEDQLAIQPSPDRWPLWASIGHLACQRVFGLCDFGGAPGAAESPFPNAGFDCPGDDDLEHVWTRDQLVDAIDRTFAVVEWCLDNWTLETFDDVISHADVGDDRVRTRGEVLQRQFAHDVWHIAELNEALTRAGLEPIDVWN